MNLFTKNFLILELLVQLFSVVFSYTVVLKQVKPLHPSVKFYRYELRHPKILPESNTQYIYHKPLLGQRIYPVAVKPGTYKTRVPVKKDKGKFYKVTTSTEKSILRDAQLLGLSQHLVPPVSNQIEEYSEAKEEESREEENDIRPLLASPNPGKSFASFGQEKGRIYNNPGEWATPSAEANSDNTTKSEFTPSQLYLQIRHKNTVIHVPQSEALKDAETLEELINAPRLKELSRTTHVQETYSEEGYEDAGYDHAGHIRQAQHGEVYDAKDEGRFNIKEPPIILDYDSDLEESKKVPLKKVKGTNEADENLANKLEPRITRSRSEVSKTSVEYAKTPKTYKGDRKYSSRVKSPVTASQNDESQFNKTLSTEFPSAPATFPSYFDEMSPTSALHLANDSMIPPPAPVKLSSKYRKGNLNSTQIYAVPEAAPNPPVDFKPYISLIDSQASPSAKSLKYSRIYSKKTKQLRLEPYKNSNIYSPTPPPPESPPFRDLQPPPPPPSPPPPEKTKEEEDINQRIVLPTIGYINSLTTAHFGKGNPNQANDEPKPQLTDALNLTQALDYLRTNKNQKNSETTKPPTELDIRTFEPMRLKKSRSNSSSFVKKTKRDVYLIGERKRRSEKLDEEYEGNDESDAPHNEKNEEIAEDERLRIEEENREKEKYEADLKEEISKQEKEIIKETFKNIGIQDEVSEVFPEFPSGSETKFSIAPVETTPTPVDHRKYPFYRSKRLPENSALRYATDPKQFPKKSGYRMEFYDSRERLIQCPEFHPDLGDLPDSNSTEYSDEQSGDQQRLAGLGDKIACLRMKYFDPEPFDNPIFKEREIDYVGKRSKKVNKKTLPTTVSFKKDKKNQQTNQQHSLSAKPTNPKPLKLFHSGSVTNQPPNLTYSEQEIISQRIKKKTSNPHKIFSFAHSKHNSTETPRIIPVTEILNDFPPSTAKTFHQISTPRSPVGWRTTYRAMHSPDVRPQPSENTKRIVKSGNCLTKISKLAALDGTKNLTIDCDDVTLIQEIVKNKAQLRIIPKGVTKQESVLKRKWSESIPAQPDQTDWVPIVGYTLPKHRLSPKPFIRRTDELTGLKNETTQNSSTVYVIDELKEDENVRKGEVVDDMDHYMRLMVGLEGEITELTTVKTEPKAKNLTRRRRQTQIPPVKRPNQENFHKRLESSFSTVTATPNSVKNEIRKPYEDIKTEVYKPFQLKRPLSRLSGLEFLTRYHKNKGKPTNQKTEDFWKITTSKPTTLNNNQKSLKKSTTEKPARVITKIKETLEKTTSPEPPIEPHTKKLETLKESFEIHKSQTDSRIPERSSKPKIKQTSEPRKISRLNLVPEKITKKPEPKDFSKTFDINPPSGQTSKLLNFTKIITKVSREISESSGKPRIGYKQSNSNLSSSTETITTDTSSIKPEIQQYKTINRSSTPKISPIKTTESPSGPILYFVVNVKTGRGKWITNYDEQNTDNYRKPQKLKEASGNKREKRRKKPKN